MEDDAMLAYCLRQIGCEKYLHVFVDNEIDFDSFKTLTYEELCNLIPNKIGPQKKIQMEIKRIREIDAALAESQIEFENQEFVTQNMQSMNVNTPNSNEISTTIDPTAENSKEKTAFQKYGATAVGVAATIGLGTVQSLIINRGTLPMLEKVIGLPPKSSGNATAGGTQTAGSNLTATGPPANDPNVAKYYSESLTQNPETGTTVINNIDVNTNSSAIDSSIMISNSNAPTQTFAPNDPNVARYYSEPQVQSRGMMQNTDSNTNAGFVDQTYGNANAVDTASASTYGTGSSVAVDTGAGDGGFFSSIIDGFGSAFSTGGEV